MDMYQNMGDALALQYRGSIAHNTVFLERLEGKPSLQELDSNYSLHVRSNGDDSHGYKAWYKKFLSSVDLSKDFILAAHTQLCKAYKGMWLLMRLRGCHMKTCVFGIVLYVVACMPS